VYTDLQNYKQPPHRTPTNMHKNIHNYTQISESIQRPPKIHKDLQTYPETSKTIQRLPNLFRHVRNYKDICFLILAEQCYEKQSAVITLHAGPRGTGVRLPAEKVITFFSTATRSALRLTQTSIHWFVPPL